MLSMPDGTAHHTSLDMFAVIFALDRLLFWVKPTYINRTMKSGSARGDRRNLPSRNATYERRKPMLKPISQIVEDNAEQFKALRYRAALESIANEFRGVHLDELSHAESSILRRATNVLGWRYATDRFGQVRIYDKP